MGKVQWKGKCLCPWDPHSHCGLPHGERTLSRHLMGMNCDRMGKKSEDSLQKSAFVWLLITD
jgi:hypothetical protein